MRQRQHDTAAGNGMNAAMDGTAVRYADEPWQHPRAAVSTAVQMVFHCLLWIDLPG